jgi:hypothetical protein
MGGKQTAAWLGALVLAFGIGASCQPPPDEDANIGGARSLPLTRWHSDALDCRRRVRDCADWFAFTVPGEGDVQIDLVKNGDGTPIPAFDLIFADAGGREIQRSSNAGRSRLRLDHRVGGGRYAVAVGIPEGVSGGMGYELRVLFRPKPEEKPPQFEQVSALVLEIEPLPDGGEALTINKGQDAGIARGQRGRLLEKGEAIGEIEVLDVYEDAARVAIVGVLRASITPSTVAEVDVPL